MRRLLLSLLRSLLFSLLVLALAVPALAQAKHPFTFEDMMKLKRVGDPQVSPDGKWVIFSVVDVDLEANTKKPHIWIVPLGVEKNHVGTAAPGRPAEQSSASSFSPEHELITDQDADRPRWSPDGKRFAFLSTKEGGSQVWIADFDDAAGTVTSVHKLTSIATEAGGELWSPDGKNILFTTDVYPECNLHDEGETDCNNAKLAEANKSKVKAQIFEHLLYRHWNAYKEGKRSHLFIVDANSQASFRKGVGNVPLYVRYIDLTPGDYDAPVFSLGGQDDYAFSPDGQEICYASNHDKNPAASTNNDLWIVPVTGGTAKNITADNPASDTSPLYSPDGRYIAYRAQQRPGYESDRFRLMLYDRKTGEKKNLTENFDHWVGSFGWAGRHEIILTAEDEGQSPIYSVMPEACPNGCHPIKVLDGFNDDIFAGENTVAAKEATNLSELIAFSRMSLQAPSELFTTEHGNYAVGLDKIRAMLSGESKESLPKDAMARPRQLTHLNDAVLSQVAMSPHRTLLVHWCSRRQSRRLLGQAAEFRCLEKISCEVSYSWRAAGGLGRRLVVSLESRTVRGANFWVIKFIDAQRIRRHHDQLPRLDRIRAEVYRCHQRRLGRSAV